jgi:hypothetical protein
MKKIIEIADSNWYLLAYGSLAAFGAGGMIGDTFGPTPVLISGIAFAVFSLPFLASIYIQALCNIDSQSKGKHRSQDDHSGH